MHPVNCLLVRFIADCPGLSAPADGQVNPTTNVSTGQSAKYTCDAGFSIIGSDTRTCQDDGTWSGSQPVCGSEYTFQIINAMGLNFLKIIQCRFSPV